MRAPAALVASDSVVLQSGDTLELARPEIDFAVSDDGHIWVMDRDARHLVEYQPTGEPIRVFGGKGRGPGEFNTTTRAILVLDSLVIPATFGVLHVFRRDGAFVRSTRTAWGYPSEMHLVGDSVLFSLYDFGERRSLGLVALARLVRGDSTEHLSPPGPTFGEAPREYRDYPELRTFAMATVIPVADGFWVGFAGVDYLTRLGVHWKQTGDTLRIPAVRRPAVTNAVLEEGFSRTSRTPDSVRTSAISVLSQGWRDSHGRLVLEYQWYRQVGPSSDPRFFSRSWITVIDPVTGRGCFDMELPFPGSDDPKVAFAADTVYALDQVERESSRIESVVRKYPIGGLSCRDHSSPP